MRYSVWDMSKATAALHHRAAPPAKARGYQAYRQACARVGAQPDPDIEYDLREHGALVVDLQLCREVEPILICLREAPAGVHQLVLYNGLLFFGCDARYCMRYRAASRRKPPSSLRDEETMREMTQAIVVFCVQRGAGLAVLDLSGVPMSRKGPSCFPFLASRCLPGLTCLQRLHLIGCGMQDRGFGLLLPLLVKCLPKLAYLSVAKNGLRDVRQIAKFLQGRTFAQQRRRAVPLCVLDLSENPRLGVHCAGRGQWPDGPGSKFPVPLVAAAVQPHWSAAAGPPKRDVYSFTESREVLFETICEALQSGLKLRSLRLESMCIRRDDLRPLIQLLYREVAHRQAGFDGFFPLVSVALDNNPIEPEFRDAVENALWQLANRPAGQPGPGQPVPPEQQVGPPMDNAARPPGWPPPHVQFHRRRADSLPPPEGPEELMFEADDAERNAMSDGDAPSDEESDDGLDPHTRRAQRLRKLAADWARLRPQVVNRIQDLAEERKAATKAITVVTITCATNLCDMDGGIYRNSDPYCVCELMGPTRRKEIWQTKTIKNSQNPRWQHSKEIAGIAPGDALVFTVRDADPQYMRLRADDLLGEARLTYHQLFSQPRHSLKLTGGRHVQGVLVVDVNQMHARLGKLRTAFVRTATPSSSAIPAGAPGASGERRGRVAAASMPVVDQLRYALDVVNSDTSLSSCPIEYPAAWVQEAARDEGGFGPIYHRSAQQGVYYH